MAFLLEGIVLRHHFQTCFKILIYNNLNEYTKVLQSKTTITTMAISIVIDPVEEVFLDAEIIVCVVHTKEKMLLFLMKCILCPENNVLPLLDGISVVVSCEVGFCVNQYIGTIKDKYNILKKKFTYLNDTI
ncbi:hypothetical protein RFI_30378 [Reticulomyxa filosa]|uniref:Uncharacterized protein n=1 Tax=Reticulomyxa filosa TaxID=46433 RepID=X6M088_RETFI|nr:hypothetical protein RFI_30378 [Reticulomyxa filosa]|eukprot:ETO07016.1 hypothetical protein RFI_30378 [Reticulomyxa filosa]